jgi:hypothetical protein
VEGGRVVGASWRINFWSSKELNLVSGRARKAVIGSENGHTRAKFAQMMSIISKADNIVVVRNPETEFSFMCPHVEPFSMPAGKDTALNATLCEACSEKVQAGVHVINAKTGKRINA